MKKMNYLVIDKSYLQKAKRETLGILSATNRIIVPDVLMYEISTSTDFESSISCFKKLLFVKDYVELLPQTGMITKYEFEKNRPCTKISEQFYQPHIYEQFWNFVSECIRHPSKSTLNLNPLNSMYHNFYEVDGVTNIIQIGNNLGLLFPNLKGYKTGSKNVDFDELKDRVMSKPAIIKKHLYDYAIHEGNSIYKRDFTQVDENWMFFKAFQVYLIYCLIFVEKYGHKPGLIKSKRLPHDVIDLEYVTSGIFAGRIASGDNLIKNIFCLFHTVENCFS